MPAYTPSKRDTDLLRKRLPKIQERYMGKLCRDYAEILLEPFNSIKNTNADGEGDNNSTPSSVDNNSTPSSSCWLVYRRFLRDTRRAGVSAQLTIANMVQVMNELIDDGAIGMRDLEGFTDETREYFGIRIRRRSAGEDGIEDEDEGVMSDEGGNE